MIPYGKWPPIAVRWGSINSYRRHLIFKPLCVLQAALKQSQPSSKREGFATVPNVTWDHIGALQSVHRELQKSIIVCFVSYLEAQTVFSYFVYYYFSAFYYLCCYTSSEWYVSIILIISYHTITIHRTKAAIFKKNCIVYFIYVFIRILLRTSVVWCGWLCNQKGTQPATTIHQSFILMTNLHRISPEKNGPLKQNKTACFYSYDVKLFGIWIQYIKLIIKLCSYYYYEDHMRLLHCLCIAGS